LYEADQSRLISREVLLTILKATQTDQTIGFDELAELSRTPRSLVQTYIEKLAAKDSVSIVDGVICIDDEQRIAIAVEALKDGADPERVCRKLNWKEFEQVTLIALDSNGYDSKRHFIFKQRRKRWEIDIVGVKGRLVLCVDCKHWTYGWQRSRITTAVQQQIVRTKALADEISNHIKRLRLSDRTEFTFVPILVTLADVCSRNILNVPIVPVLRMRSFLDGLSDQVSPPFLSFVGNATRITSYLDP
jgi:hypothetical protein